MSRSTRSLLAPLAATLALSLGLAACAGDEDPAPQAKPSPSASSTAPSASPEPQPEYWPFTGFEKTTKGYPKRPALVVKFDNTPASRPQIGVPRADMVVEELVEGGMTRLAVFFYSDVPKRIGPVRSLRATDIGFVKPTGGTLVASGAAQPTFKRLRAAKVRFHADPDNRRSKSLGFYREGGRAIPYNLFAYMPQVLKHVPTAKATVPPAYFDFGTSPQWAKAPKRSEIAARFSDRSTTQWRWNGNRWVNLNSNSEGPGFRPRTVVVLRVKEKDAGYLDPAGFRVPETILAGGGPATVFSDGRAVTGQWSKKGNAGPLRLTAQGQPLRIPRGKVWIELVPLDRFGGGLSSR